MAHHLEQIKAFLSEESWDGLIITGTDPHGSEYLCPRWETREWASGFTGSAGLLAVTRTRGALWTDSRYWLQADTQLSGTGIELMKEGNPDTLDVMDWLGQALPSGSRIGFDGSTTPWLLWGKFQAQARDSGLILTWKEDLFFTLWPSRPEMPHNPIYDYQSQGFSQPRVEKISELRHKLKGKAHVISSLDDIAWLTNLRGSDIPFNPVFLSYLYIDSNRVLLFAGPERMDPKVLRDLNDQGVTVQAYEDFGQFISSLDPGSVVTLDPARSTVGLCCQLEDLGIRVNKTLQPTLGMKACKTSSEISGIRTAMIRDGAAMVRFYRWWYSQEEAQITEAQAADKIHEFRSLFPEYRGESFETIPGWKDHGAVVHYALDEGSAGALIQGPGLLLLDSGGQYIDGTTDITRVFKKGKISPQEKSDYTLVLKAHIHLAATSFPEGTRGYQLDTLARQGLWAQGLNYGHGTGHGVGHFLCVHEGPARISPNPIDVPLKPGMVLSNEPGLYRPGRWGIRLENLVLVTEDRETEFGKFLKMETLTLAPFDRNLIDQELLTQDEKEWLMSYHEQVLNRLSSLLTPEEKNWLATFCALE